MSAAVFMDEGALPRHMVLGDPITKNRDRAPSTLNPVRGGGDDELVLDIHMSYEPAPLQQQAGQAEARADAKCVWRA